MQTPESNNMKTQTYTSQFINLATLGTVGVCLFALGACTAGESIGSIQESEAWNRTNDPRHFSYELNYKLDELPLDGRTAHEAWPSSYWPTYEDSVNHRWQYGKLSPAEKYDKAFNNWVPEANFMSYKPFSRDNATSWDPEYYQKLGPFATYVSEYKGNKQDRDASIAAGVADGSATGRPDEWPVEHWWGLCHAWVPAAMLEDRPLQAVEYNGVRFEVGDIEALLIAAYDRSNASMLGDRCNEGHGNDDLTSYYPKEVERDESGRPTNVACRDTNPGSFHVIMTNFLGINKKSYAEDRTYDYQVWNQPMVEYEVSKLVEIDIATANSLLNVTGTTYTFNSGAVKLYEVEATTYYLGESLASTQPQPASSNTYSDDHHYILEVDAAGNIIGGEWLKNRWGQIRYPDFLWLPERNTRSSMPYLDMANIRLLIEKSRPVDPVDPVDPNTACSLSADGELQGCLPRCSAETAAAINACGDDASCQDNAIAADATPAADYNGTAVTCDVCIGHHRSLCAARACPAEASAYYTCTDTGAECAAEGQAFVDCLLSSGQQSYEDCALADEDTAGLVELCFGYTDTDSDSDTDTDTDSDADSDTCNFASAFAITLQPGQGGSCDWAQGPYNCTTTENSGSLSVACQGLPLAGTLAGDCVPDSDCSCTFRDDSGFVATYNPHDQTVTIGSAACVYDAN